MDSDWDVLQQIIFSLRLFPSLPEIRFIQGHQDDNCPYTTLSLPAQLNVDADHLAGSYIPCLDENPTIITTTAGSAVSLHLLSGTITMNTGVLTTRQQVWTPFNTTFRPKTNGAMTNLLQSTGLHMATQYTASTTKNSLLSSLFTSGYV